MAEQQQKSPSPSSNSIYYSSPSPTISPKLSGWTEKKEAGRRLQQHQEEAVVFAVDVVKLADVDDENDGNKHNNSNDTTGNGGNKANEEENSEIERKRKRKKRRLLYCFIGGGGGAIIVSILIIALVATAISSLRNKNDQDNNVTVTTSDDNGITNNNNNNNNNDDGQINDPNNIIDKNSNSSSNNNNNGNGIGNNMDEDIMNSDMGVFFRKMIADVLPNNSLEITMVDYESPQYKAFTYLVENNNMEQPLTLSELEQSKAMTIFSLVTFYYSLNGPNWYTNKNWLNPDVSICEWHGVVCKGDLVRRSKGRHRRRRTEDMMYDEKDNDDYYNNNDNNNNNNNNNVEDDKSVRQLQQHQQHQLRGLQTGSPEILFDADDDFFIDYDDNDVDDHNDDDDGYFDDESTVPIRSLELKANNLSGNLPDELGLLTNIFQLIDLQVNNIVGTIPSTLSMLSRLQEFDLHSNELSSSESLPTELGRMTDLRRFDISSNPGIKGTFPSEFQKWTKLEQLEIQGTNLSGQVPNEFCEMIINNRTSNFKYFLDAGKVVLKAACPYPLRCACCTECCQTANNSGYKYSGSEECAPVP